MTSLVKEAKEHLKWEESRLKRQLGFMLFNLHSGILYTTMDMYRAFDNKTLYIILSQRTEMLLVSHSVIVQLVFHYSQSSIVSMICWAENWRSI